MSNYNYINTTCKLCDNHLIYNNGDYKYIISNQNVKINNIIVKLNPMFSDNLNDKYVSTNEI